MENISIILYILLLLAGLVLSIFVFILAPLKLYSIDRTLRLILDEMRLSRSGAPGESYLGSGFKPRPNRGPWVWGMLVGAGLIGFVILFLTYR